MANIDRRRFLRTSAAGAAFLTSTRVFGAKPQAAPGAKDLNGKLRLASVGVGGKGQDDLNSISASPRVEVVALCDVDSSHDFLGWAAEKYPKADRYGDFRRLMDKASTFDAVSVSTPDHMHAPVALAAIALGKHVFCQKPLAHSVHEARQMREAAAKHGVVTQMGNQIQSSHAYRNAVQAIHDGAIGRVKEVHAWQGGSMDWLIRETRPAETDPIPKSLDWDAWLGVAPVRPYKKGIYHRWNWRAWQDFSSGQLGDFGCHILDPVFMALELTSPTSIEADAPPMNKETWTKKSTVKYTFPRTQRTAGDEVVVTWYDGVGHIPNHEGWGLPEMMEVDDVDKEGKKKGKKTVKFALPGAGSAIIGEKGTLITPHWADASLYPESRAKEFKMPTLPDIDHYTSWAHACLGDGTTRSNFDYSGPLTEAVLLGAIALRFPKEQLMWDSKELEFTHHADATARVTKEYRKGWGMPRT